MKVRKSEGLNNLIVIEISIGEGNRPLANCGKMDTNLRERKEITGMHERKLLDRILDTDNLDEALKQVKRNKGSAGVDGMTVDSITGYMALNKDEIFHQIRQRKYKPKPVLRVEIPKPNGGTRLLGIPTVLDRVIQQAIAQVLTPMFDKLFSEYSYGFE